MHNNGGPIWCWWDEYDRCGDGVKCPYGKPGDRLWVRETWNGWNDPRGAVIAYRATCPDNRFDFVTADGLIEQRQILKWKPPVLMPRWASRIALEVTDVRVERVQSISEVDAIAEGVLREDLPSDPDNFHPPGSYGYVSGLHPFPKGSIHPKAMQAYAELWDSINGGWNENPWVWVIEFKKVK